MGAIDEYEHLKFFNQIQFCRGLGFYEFRTNTTIKTKEVKESTQLRNSHLISYQTYSQGHV